MRQPCGKYGEYDLRVHLCAQPLDGSFGQPQGIVGVRIGRAKGDVHSAVFKVVAATLAIVVAELELGEVLAND